MKKSELKKYYRKNGRKGIKILREKMGEEKFIAHMKSISALGVKARKRLRIADK